MLRFAPLRLSFHQVHLIMFVHRVTGLEPGIYAFMRDLRVVESWRAVMRQDMLWEPVEGSDSHTDRYHAGAVAACGQLLSVDCC